MKLFILSIILITMFLYTSCEKENESIESKYGSNDSHNNGQNCMQCHKQGGAGEGNFIVAGSVYNSSLTGSYVNATIYLNNQNNGDGAVVAVIEGDALGNFYTSNNIQFGTGLYVSVKGTNGDFKYMGSPVTNGSCSSCHGNTQTKIWVN